MSTKYISNSVQNFERKVKIKEKEKLNKTRTDLDLCIFDSNCKEIISQGEIRHNVNLPNSEILQ